MNQADREQVTQIFRTVFNQSDLELHDDLTASDVAAWDSLNHINMIVTIENTFGIRFNHNEISQLENVGQLLRLLDTKR